MGRRKRPLFLSIVRESSGASRRRVILLGSLLLVGIAAGASLGYIWKKNRSRPISTPVAVRPQRISEGVMEKHVFTSRLAGRWYPANPETLAGTIDEFVNNATGEVLENVQAIILPHAGYQYSGPTAGYGLRAIARKQYARVIVMGPSHRLRMHNSASLPRGTTHYETPLGEIPLDVDSIEALLGYAEFRSIPEAHSDEHSVQIELPMLQKTLGAFKLVPIVIGQTDLATTRRMAQILLGLVDPDTLVVASTDFTHYGAYFSYLPFKEDIPENLKKLDMGAWDCVARKDLDAFFDYVEDTGATICGRCPVGILLAMLPDQAEAHLLHYETSGARSNDFSHSVSYVSAAFTGAWPKGEPAEMAGNEALLSVEDKQGLLTLARRALEYTLEHGGQPTPEQLGVTVSPGMEQVMGAFVTLHKHGQLRGCIGEIIPHRPVCQVVIAEAINAALHDPRFPPVEAAELPELDIEISAYPSGPEPVGSYEGIIIGKHGMVLEKYGRHALFLPQVAPEQGWDLPATLTHLSMKAGLAPDAWKEGASFSVFEATVFGEEKG